MLSKCRPLIAAVAILAGCLAAGSVLAQQSGRIFPFKWSSPIAYEDITTADIQHALIWTRQYWGTTDGALGPLTRKAVRDWLISKGYPAADTLTPAQSVELVSSGLRQRDAFGWALLKDETVGFSVGIPTKLSAVTDPQWKDGGLQYAAYGPVATS